MDELNPPAASGFVHPSQRSSRVGGPRETLLYVVRDAEAQHRVVRALGRSGRDEVVTVPLRSGRGHLVAVHCDRTWESLRSVRRCVAAAEPGAEQVLAGPGRVDLTAPEGPWAVVA